MTTTSCDIGKSFGTNLHHHMCQILSSSVATTRPQMALTPGRSTGCERDGQAGQGGMGDGKRGTGRRELQQQRSASANTSHSLLHLYDTT